MAFMARVKELVNSIVGVDETDELNIIDENDESKVKDIIMIHPDLLKALASLGNKEKEVEIGIADTNDASSKKNKSYEFKRSLDTMTKILGKNEEKVTENEERATGNEQQEIVD